MVRLVRENGSNSSFRLCVYGPETEVVTHDFSDIAACMKGQAEIEHRLLAAGYHLTILADRRGEYESRADPIIVGAQLTN